MKLRLGSAEEAGMSKAKLNRLEHMIPEWIDQDITSAIIGIVVRKGIIVLNKAVGQLGPEAGSPQIETDTLFPLASISKTITATAAMILVEEGLLSLNRPVSSYIPEFIGENKEKVMVHHLLTHTSGFNAREVYDHVNRKRGTVDIPHPDLTQHPGIHEWLYLALDATLSKEPGTEMSYLNFGIDLVGELIRRISGRSLSDFFRERIFEPLGMKNTYLIVPKQAQTRVVRFPSNAEHAPFLNSEEIYETPSAAAGVYSTAHDMAIFGQMFLNRGIYDGVRILSPLTVDEMTRNQIPGTPAVYGDETFGEASWGLGWNVFGNKKDIESGPLHSPKAYGHGGAGRCMFWIDPEYEMVGMIFYIKFKPEYRRPDDLFRNMVMSAVEDC